MKQKQPITLICNKCEEQTFTAPPEIENLADARYEAHKVGWSHSGGTIDHCSNCAGPNRSSTIARKEKKEQRGRKVREVRNKLVRDLADKDFSTTEIADATGLTRQRIHQILQEGEA